MVKINSENYKNTKFDLSKRNKNFGNFLEFSETMKIVNNS
jgi:hypothetical protein